LFERKQTANTVHQSKLIYYVLFAHLAFRRLLILADHNIVLSGSNRTLTQQLSFVTALVSSLQANRLRIPRDKNTAIHKQSWGLRTSDCFATSEHWNWIKMIHQRTTSNTTQHLTSLELPLGKMLSWARLLVRAKSPLFIVTPECAEVFNRSRHFNGFA
jgi:hypothetical protein